MLADVIDHLCGQPRCTFCGMRLRCKGRFQKRLERVFTSKRSREVSGSNSCGIIGSSIL